MKSYAAKLNIGMIFVIIQSILYLTFLFLDITDGSITLSNCVKYSIIIFCFCYALFYARSADKSIIFITTALFFTLISDLFILLLDYYFYGVLTFIVAQQLYNFFLAGLSVKQNKYIKSNRYHKFIIRITCQVFAASVVCFILQQLGINIEKLVIASVFYFISIITNVIIAIITAINSPKNKGILLFALGMALFLLCDINVGLFNLSGFISMPKYIYDKIYTVSSILMWTFYAPSQVLIALSTRKFKAL